MTENAVHETERLVVTRILNAPRELVWKAWTDPEYVKQWWGPHGFTTPVCKIDFRVGGKYLYCMKAPDGQEFWNGGEYHEIVPQEKIVSSMYFSDPEGNRVQPEHYGVEHTALEDVHDVTLFEDLGNGQTRLTFIGNESMQDAIKSGQLEGMKQILDKLADVVAGLAESKLEVSPDGVVRSNLCKTTLTQLPSTGTSVKGGCVCLVSSIRLAGRASTFWSNGV